MTSAEVTSYVKSLVIMAGVVACTCNQATSEAKFRNGVGSILVGGNSPSIGWWIVCPLVIQHKEKSLSKSWDLTKTYQWTEVLNQAKLATVK